MQMPFGKHKGKNVWELPTSYLVWLSGLEDLSPWLRDAVEAALDVHLGRRSPASSAAGLPVWEPVVGRWYRELVMRHHPDRGGDTRVMQALNDAHDKLRAMLAEAVA